MNEYEEYVTYAQAKALKELGFNWPCRHYATKRDAPEEHYWNCTPELLICNSMMLDCEFAVPTQAAVCRWLREEKWISVESALNPKMGYNYSILYTTSANQRDIIVSNPKFSTYEAAISAGINRALELLKGGEQ